MKAVLWDLDGTLVDSADYHFESWLDALGSEGVAITREDFLATFGQRNDRILARWLGADAQPERVARVADAKERAYRRYVRERGLEPLPGAAHWVRRLHDGGWKQAVASSAPRANIDVVLDVLGWTDLFAAVASGDDVRAGKPDPEVFLLAARRLGAQASACIVVEDAAAGVEAARRGAMRCIGVGDAAARAEPDIAAAALDRLPADAFDRLLSS